MIIYLITNTVNGKLYVGQTIHGLSWRWNIHKAMARRGNKVYFHAAIRKYGEEAFVPSVLASAENVQELNELEIAFIAKLKTADQIGRAHV